MSPRAVLITGASRGIGAAIARAFAATGDNVAVHYHQARSDAEKVLGSLAGLGHIVVQADIRDPAQVQSMVNSTARQLGGLDVLVNNAGVYLPHDVTATSYEEWQHIWNQTLAVNLTGTANVTWCALRHMLQHRSGRIVNVSSWGAFRGEPNQPAYGVSKAGINSLGQSLARALGRNGVTVMTIAPGWIETEMTANRLATELTRIEMEAPLGRIATLEEVAHAVLYLASPQAEFASGAILDFNGAGYIRP